MHEKNERIEFDGKYYNDIKKYFDSNNNLFSKPERKEPIVYFSNKTYHGILLEKKPQMKDIEKKQKDEKQVELVTTGVVVINPAHPFFNEIKKNLEKIISK